MISDWIEIELTTHPSIIGYATGIKHPEFTLTWSGAFARWDRDKGEF